MFNLFNNFFLSLFCSSNVFNQCVAAEAKDEAIYFKGQICPSQIRGLNHNYVKTVVE